jgi:hypothetical protein
MATHIVTKGQCLMDVAVQRYGSVEAQFDLCKDNNLEVDDDITPGQILQIRDVLPDTADQDVVDYFTTNGFRVNSGADLTITELLADNDNEILTDNDNGGLEV